MSKEVNSLADVIAHKYRNVRLTTEDRMELERLSHTMYKTACYLGDCKDAGAAYAQLMRADVETKRTLEAMAGRMRASA